MNIDQVIARKGTLDDLIFRGKNKDYGAYFLRKVYPEHIKKSLILFLVLVSAIAGAYKIYDILKDKVIWEKEKPIRKVTELKAPPPLEDKKTPPPPPPPPPPPVKATIQFVPPKIVEVAQEEIKTNEEVIQAKAEISTTTQVGTDQAPEIGEEPGPGPVEQVRTEPYTTVEIYPEYVGGDAAMERFLQNNIKHPPQAIEADIEGTVYVQFVVEADGSVTKAKVLKSVGYGCDEEALRVVRKMPKWKPGRQGGSAVPVYFELPINFQFE